MPLNGSCIDLVPKEIFSFLSLLLILYSWVLIDCWGRFLNNFTFSLLKLNPDSTFDTLMIALCLTFIIFCSAVYLKIIDEDSDENSKHEVITNMFSVLNRESVTFGALDFLA